MSTQQVERLQALLERVKQNRSAPRPAGASATSPGVNNAPKAKPAAAAAQPAPQAPVPPATTTARKPAPPPQAPTTPVGMPSPARAASAPVAAMDDELDFSSLPPPGASRAPAQEPAFTPAERRTRPGATPLEMAVEDTLDRPVVAPVVPLQPRAAQPAGAPAAPAAPAAPPPQAAPAAHAAPASAPRGASREGVVLADPLPANPARPIAQVLSKQAPIVPTSFGDLLKRSLSLRPR